MASLTASNIIEVNSTITQQSATLPSEPPFISGGVVLTGFLDVEKLITGLLTTEGVSHTLLLEKKLPFQILVLDIDPPAESSWNSSNGSLTENE